MFSYDGPAARTPELSRIIGNIVASAQIRSLWLRYGLALGLPCLSFLVTWKLFDLHRGPYLVIFTISIVITSLVGGRGPGLIDTVVSSILGFLLAPPAFTVHLAQAEDGVRVGILAFMGLLISTIIGAVGDLQRKLHDESAMLALTLRSIGDGMITTDENARVTFLNETAQRATGWTLDGALGRTIEEVFSLRTLDTRAVMNPVREVLRTGSPILLTDDTILLRHDGTEILICDGAAPIRNNRNEIAGVVVIFQNVTRVRAEADLERHRLREIMANSPAAVGVLRGPEHRWEYVNPQYIRVTGRTSVDDFVRKTLGESLPEIVSQPFIKLADEVYRTGVPHFGSEARATLNRANGEPEDAYFDFVYQPLRDLGGQIDGILVHALEVTERVEARKQRQESEKIRRRLATIVDSTDDAILSKDLNGLVTSWNPAAERILGYTAQEMIGRSILSVIPPELQKDEQRILSTIARGRRIEHFETIRLTKSGEHISVSLTISPLLDEAARVIGASTILRDITRQKKADKALQQSEKLASVGRLAATIAHEINNPLEAVTNLVYLAKNCVVDANVQEYLDLAEEELKRAAYITRQTLGFYRETRGATAVRLGQMLSTAILVASKIRNKGIEILSEVRQDPEINAVPSEIRQLMTNLLSNSIDAVDANGFIRVRVSAGRLWSGGKYGARLVVADSGSGIPAKLRSNLFEPFFTTKKDIGTGLGLWVCKNIVEKHGGAIQMKSSTAAGRSWTVFSIFLPAHPAELCSAEVTAVRQ